MSLQRLLVAGAVLPFIAVLWAGLAVVILVPWFTLVLPRLFKLL